jgi:hypothetical protein
VNWSALVMVEVPPAVVTVMFTVPLPSGAVTTTSVLESELIVTPTPPKLTLVAPDRFVPTMSTVLP